MVTLKNMTLRQFQQIVKISESDMNEVEQSTEIIAILTGQTTRQLDEMPYIEFKELAKRVTAEVKKVDITTKGFRINKIKCPARTYSFMYDLRKINFGQWITVMHFAKENTLQNAHLILATIAQPVKWGFKIKADTKKHKDYAEDILDAPVMDVYNACVFFCRKFQISFTSIQDFLIKQIAETNPIEAQQVREMVDSLPKITDGFIAQKKWQTITASNL